MGDQSRFHCDFCKNSRRFFYRATIQGVDGSIMEQTALAAQEPDGIYLIIGTGELKEGEGPAAIGMAHLFCGICKTNISMPVYDICVKEVKGWKGIQVLLDGTETEEDDIERVNEKGMD